MPIEVIELPSSPEPCLPPPRAISKPKSTEKWKVKPSNGESHNSNNQRNDDEWFVLSDDEDWYCHKHQRSSFKLSESSRTAKSGPVAGKRGSLAPDHFEELGGVSDPVNLDFTFGRVFSSPPLPKFVSNANSMILGRKEALTGVGGFFDLSDDSENHININEPFKLMSKDPQGKKRKRASEPSAKLPTNGFGQKDNGLPRALSGIENKSRIGGKVQKSVEFNRSKNMVRESDPIDLSSEDEYSRMARQRRMKAKKMRELEWGSDSNNSEDLPRLAPQRKKRTPKRASAADISSDTEMPDVRRMASSVSASNHSSIPHNDSAQALAKYNAEKAAAQKSREKAIAAQEKALAKEAEKERKLVAKEEKAREKENAAALARVNTMRIDKKVSTPEMIVDYPLDVDSNLADQIRSFLKPLSVECKPWLSTIPNVFKWRRKSEAIYNEEERRWEPTRMYVKDENHVLCYMLAAQFVDLAVGVDGDDLDTHVIMMKSKFVGCTLIYLIEGLTAWMRKNKNIRNRQFTEGVRSQMSQDHNDNATGSQRARKTKNRVYIDTDVIEDELLRLQVIHGALIHHTAAMIETAQWVMTFTQHISTIPGRLEKMSLDTGFCMDSGQVKTGDNPADTFVKMLQEITRVTPPIAYGIAAEYPSARKLIEGFEEGGKDILTSLKKCSNKDGGLTDREVGRKISRRVWSIFMSRDETSTDI